MLLQDGLSPDVVDACGNNALHLASTGGRAQVVESLLGHGSDLSVRNWYGNTAMALATSHATRTLIEDAEGQEACAASGKKFSPTVRRFRCDLDGKCYCEEVTVTDNVVAAVGSARLKPVRYYEGNLEKIKEAEQQLKEPIEKKMRTHDCA